MPHKGGKRKKSRTHKVPPPGTPLDKTPRSLVLRRGHVDTSLSELLRDLRQLMMPHTAPRLRTTKGNTLRDFVDVAGPLGVSHLLMLSQSDTNVALRVARTPRGPTLTFRVESYTLARQVRGGQRRPVDVSGIFNAPPLVVMHNFSNVGPEPGRAPGAAGVPLADALKLAVSTFQHMFPAINPATVRLDEARRVVLVHFNKATRTLELRHYAVRAVPVGVTRGVKRVAGGAGAGSRLPDLGRMEDISEFVLGNGRGGGGGGGGSDSEHEAAADEASRVVLPADFRGRGNVAAQQSAIRLAEIGPRLSLRLVKLEQGLCGGEVLYHGFVAKTAAEAAELRVRAAGRDRLRAERKSAQDANVARKEETRAVKKAAREERKAARQGAAVAAAAEGKLGDGEDEEGEDGEDGADDNDDDDDDDDGADADGESADGEDVTDSDDDAEGGGSERALAAAAAAATGAEVDSGDEDKGDEDGAFEDDELHAGSSSEESEGEAAPAPAPAPAAASARLTGNKRRLPDGAAPAVAPPAATVRGGAARGGRGGSARGGGRGPGGARR